MSGFDFELESELTYKYTVLSVSNKENYTTRFILQGVQINLSCGYNTRNGLRWVVLRDSDGDVLLSQTFLKFGKRCELNFISNLNNLNYYLTIKPKETNTSFSDSYDYLNWADDFELCFVGYAQALLERLKNNSRIIRVSN